jgi:hypothetical protein
MQILEETLKEPPGWPDDSIGSDSVSMTDEDRILAKVYDLVHTRGFLYSSFSASPRCIVSSHYFIDEPASLAYIPVLLLDTSCDLLT